jgi:hypothetical protein
MAITTERNQVQFWAIMTVLAAAALLVLNWFTNFLW